MPLSLQVVLGQAVKARREELGLTQEQLAMRGGLQQKWISNIETGKRDLQYTSLRRLAPLLELSAAELLGRAEARELRAAEADGSLAAGAGSELTPVLGSAGVRPPAACS